MGKDIQERGGEMIEVQDLTKYYGNVIALSGVNFSVEQGEILGFLGPNGAGKTTTIRILTGFIPPTSGRARVAGFDISEAPLEVKKRIGYMPENVPLYGDMGVERYLLFVAELKGVSRSKRRSHIGEIMERCGIREVAQRPIGKLSKGYRQRVGIAQALVGDPEVLILDEPTIGLDPKQIVEIREMIKSFGGEKTVLLSTHILPEVSMTCDRVVIINQGKVLAQDTPESLAARLRGVRKLILQVEGPEEEVLNVLGDIQGVREAKKSKDLGEEKAEYLIEAKEDVRREVARAVVEKGWGLLELRPDAAMLEEVFVQLVTEEEA